MLSEITLTIEPMTLSTDQRSPSEELQMVVDFRTRCEWSTQWTFSMVGASQSINPTYSSACYQHSQCTAVYCTAPLGLVWECTNCSL